MNKDNGQLEMGSSLRGEPAASNDAQEQCLGVTATEKTSTNNNNSPPVFSNLKFEFDAENQVLYAVLHHEPHKQKFGLDEINSYLAKKGYDKYQPTENNPENLMLRIENAQEGKFEVCRKLDATITIEISEDNMTAWVSLSPAYGGTALTQEQVLTTLQASGLHPRFYAGNVIADLLAEPVKEHQVLAQGIACVNGIDASFVFLVQETLSKELVEDAHGHADFHDLNEFIIVEKGAPLLRKVPPTPGKDGFDLKGNPLKARPGKDITFSNKHSGSKIDPFDENLLIADIKGHPILAKSSVKVDPVLRLENVDIKTGNINFDGAVRIAGDVTAGMLINASGDILIRGVVEKATLTAGNSITVSGGIFGSETTGKEDKTKTEDIDHQHEKPASSHFNHLLKAGGMLTAKFINMSAVDCGQDTVVAEYILNTTLNTHGQLLLGKRGGKGCLIGGHCHANNGVIANSLGNEHYHKTYVSAGYTKQMVHELAELSALRHQQEGLLAQLLDGLRALEHAAAAEGVTDSLGDKMTKFAGAITQVEAELHSLSNRHSELETVMTASAEAKVVVRNKTYANVFLCINGIDMPITEELGAGSFYVKNNKICFK